MNDILNDIHNLKILPEYFQAVLDGTKKFELRKADRDFKINDLLILLEINPDKDKKEETIYTGRVLSCKITYILKNVEKYGLRKGYCILSIDDVKYTGE